MSNKLEQLEFKLEKKLLGFKNMQEKLENLNVLFNKNFTSSHISGLFLPLQYFVHLSPLFAISFRQPATFVVIFVRKV